LKIEEEKTSDLGLPQHQPPCCRGAKMLLVRVGLVLWSLVVTTTALYGSGDAVVDLTPANFDKQARTDNKLDDTVDSRVSYPPGS